MVRKGFVTTSQNGWKLTWRIRGRVRQLLYLVVCRKNPVSIAESIVG